MLTEIRKYSKSFVVKILFGILIASFAAWGVDDMIRVVQTGSGAAIKVGDQEVGPNEVADQMRREIRRLQTAFGSKFGVEEAKTLGVVESVVQRLTNDTALLVASQQIGVAISDDMIRDAVHKTAAFQGLGGFDRNRFQQVLNQNEMSEAWYLDQVRRQMSRNQLLESVALSSAPKSLVDSLYRRRQEKRIAETVFTTDVAQQDIPQPVAAALEGYYKSHTARFTAPEYRALTVIRLDAADLAAEVAVTEAQIKEAYEAREDEFTVQESRRVQQMILTTQEDADRAHKALSEGRAFAAVAKDVAKMEADRIELGNLTRKELLEALADVVFSLEKNRPSAPVKSPLGWHLFQVTDIQPGSKKTLDQARDEIRKAIAHEKAVDGLFQLANKLDDLLGGGAKLEEAAKQLNMKVTTIAAINSDGLDPAGKPIAGVPKGEFLTTAFATNEGADSQLVETGRDGFFVLRVDKITPPALKPLDTVKAEVTEAWKADQRAEKAKKAAEAILARLKEGAAIDAVAKGLGLTVTITPPLLRQPQQQEAQTLPQALIAGIFTVKPGESTMARGDGGYYVARLKEIIAADPTADKSGNDALAGGLRESIESDILTQLAYALRDRYGVSINRRSIDETFIGRSSGRAPAPNR